MRMTLIVSSALASLAAAASSAVAATYGFLPIASTGATTSLYSSANGNGTIAVSHAFSAGGAGALDNVNSAIFPSQFTTLFPGSGTAQGNLAQTLYNNTSIVTFDLSGYALSSSTVFGMWNTTDEVTAPTGGPAVYRVELINSSNVAVAPTTFNLMGNQDNTGQVNAHRRLLMNPATGDVTAGTVLDASGTHTDAAFWDHIPAGTKKIIVYGNLPALNTSGDGVGYYFAEVVPEPASLGLIAAAASIGLLRRRRI